MREPTTKHARYRRKLLLAGLCQRCGKPAAPYSTCLACRDKRSARLNKRTRRRAVLAEYEREILAMPPKAPPEKTVVELEDAGERERYESIRRRKGAFDLA
jgi:hypothetical protein